MVDEHSLTIKSPHQRKRRSVILLILSILAIGSGLYLLLITQAPNLVFLDRYDTKGDAVIGENRVIAAAANIDEFIYQGEEALEKGAWHRFPERGDPLTGGNFIISAHRFVFDINPLATREKSRFYNIEELAEGDGITVYWEGEEYNYTVSRKFQVAPDAVEIEDRTEDHILTLYSCTLGGRYDGRVIIQATPNFEVEQI